MRSAHMVAALSDVSRILRGQPRRVSRIRRKLQFGAEHSQYIADRQTFEALVRLVEAIGKES